MPTAWSGSTRLPGEVADLLDLAVTVDAQEAGPVLEVRAGDQTTVAEVGVYLDHRRRSAGPRRRSTTP